jgi:hypothetical protein
VVCFLDTRGARSLVSEHLLLFYSFSLGVLEPYMSVSWEYQAGERWVRFWLEWDRATMGTRNLVVKFRTYTQYVTSHEWFKEQRVMPYLLVIVPGKEQEMRIARIVEDVRMNTPELVILTTTATRLKGSGPLAQIWYQASPQSERTAMVARRSFFTTSPNPLS